MPRISILRKWLISRGSKVLSFFLLTTQWADGATYYVSKTGNDQNTCTSAQLPLTAKLSIAAGLTCMVGGDTLIVGDGTYAETMIGTIPNGNALAPTIVKAANPNKAILAPTSSPLGYVVRFSGNTFIVVDGIV